MLMYLHLMPSAGSPDPDGRQIDGLGGGTSSTSKVAIVSHSRQVYASYARTQGLPLPGLDWIDDTSEVEKICDVIYRAGQVSILDHKIDWSSTCGNMMAAVAHFSLSFFKFTLPASIPPPFRNGKTQKDTTYIWPLRILAHDTGKIFTAHVPVRAFTFISDDPTQKSNYTIRPALEGSSQIAGVPGRAPGILIESPLVDSVLPTGNERDTIEFEGKQVSRLSTWGIKEHTYLIYLQIDVSIVDTGLPVVFVSAKSLDIPLSSLLDHPAAIDSNKDLMAKLEQVRQRACTLSPNLKISPPSPKLCVVHPRCEYITTGGQKVAKDSMDLLIRTVSTGVSHLDTLRQSQGVNTFL
jgi:2-methylaconitate cis-trans-isomerase PrpF